VDIDERPKIVEQKTRIGDWEGDTIIGAKHQGAIVSLVDRCSKFTVLKKIDRKTAKAFTNLRVTSFDLMHYRIETKNKLKNFLLVNLNISFLKI